MSATAGSHAGRVIIKGGLRLRHLVTQDEYAALCVRVPDGHDEPDLTVVVDMADYDDHVSGLIWRNLNGYAIHGANLYMHRAVMGNLPAGYDTVDHIDRIKVDNRRANLRPATQSEQNANRDTRSDKFAPPSELVDIGVTELPRGVRWDSTEKRFTGADIHMLRALRAATGKAYDANGTKSAKCSILEKFASCLAGVHASMLEYKVVFPESVDADSAFNALRVRLLKEYMDIARFCHAERPEVFAAVDEREMSAGIDTVHMSLPEHVEHLLDVTCGALGITREAAAALGGPKDQTCTYGVRPDGDIMVRVKTTSRGDNVSTVLDSKHRAVWAMTKVGDDGSPLVNWDADDMRVKVHVELSMAFPRISDVFGVNVRTITLHEFVHHVLEGHPRLDGHVVVALNQQRNDVRAANLLQLPGTGKNHKAATVLPPSGIDIGMKYLPRGVSISVDGRNAGFVYVVTAGEKKRKISFTPDTAAKHFAADVSPILHGATEGGSGAWMRRNDAYQGMIDSYFQAVERG